MPAPIKVELVAHSSEWVKLAREEIARLAVALGPSLIAIHHIGSTAVPGICAKPILDLMPEVSPLAELDAARQAVEALGYEWWGEYGIAGRRYCTLNDSATGRRMVQLHCFETGNPEIERHLAFRNFLWDHPEIASEYDREKRRCRDLHPDDSHAYTDAKSPWIESTMPLALLEYRRKLQTSSVHPPQLDCGLFRRGKLQWEPVMCATDSKERFSSRVADYVRYRPGYPRAILDPLREECGLTPESVIADVGSGTGLLSKLFLDNGNIVYGVEPNAEMRAAGEQFLSSYGKFRSVAGSAEATTLPDASVDFITAGQAFHWFDPEATHREFARILKPGGWVAVIWNERRLETSALLRAYEDMLRKYSPDYAQVSAKYPEALRMAEFFGPNQVRQRDFPNEQIFDFEGFRGRLLSSSYSPPQGHPNHEPILAELRRIFDQHNQNGRVRIEYTAHIYYGQLKS